MGISTKIVKARGVKFDNVLDDELKNLYRKISGNASKKDEVIDSLSDFLWEKNIDIVLFGNLVTQTRSNPMGVILVPADRDAEAFLEKNLFEIGSSKKIQDHSEITIS
jgi:hypothetical protein